MKKIALFLLVFALLLCGCTQIDQATAGRPRIVEKITASYRSVSITLQREYTDDEKMQAVLTYLRSLRPYGTVTGEDQDIPDTDALITLHYSDSTTKVYNFHSDQYLQVNGSQWQNIKPEQGQELILLLGMMESD